MGRIRELMREQPWLPGCGLATAAAVIAAVVMAVLFVSFSQADDASRLGYFGDVVLPALFNVALIAIPIGLIWCVVGVVKAAAKRKTPAP